MGPIGCPETSVGTTIPRCVKSRNGADVNMLNTGRLLGHIKSTTKNSESQFEATGVRVYPNQNQSNNFINYTGVKYNLYFSHPQPTTYMIQARYTETYMKIRSGQKVVVAEFMALLETCPA